jgi:hypothetical protein
MKWVNALFLIAVALVLMLLAWQIHADHSAVTPGGVVMARLLCTIIAFALLLFTGLSFLFGKAPTELPPKAMWTFFGAVFIFSGLTVFATEEGGDCLKTLVGWLGSMLVLASLFIGLLHCRGKATPSAGDKKTKRTTK